jgi:hypothetical protein
MYVYLIYGKRGTIYKYSVIINDCPIAVGVENHTNFGCVASTDLYNMDRGCYVSKLKQKVGHIASLNF